MRNLGHKIDQVLYRLVARKKSTIFRQQKLVVFGLKIRDVQGQPKSAISEHKTDKMTLAPGHKTDEMTFASKTDEMTFAEGQLHPRPVSSLHLPLSWWAISKYFRHASWERLMVFRE